MRHARRRHKGGGVPEQIRTSGDSTGVLVAPAYSAAMAAAVEALLADEDARRRLGDNAVADVRARFTIDRQVDAYLECTAKSSSDDQIGDNHATMEDRDNRVHDPAMNSRIGTISC